MEGDRLTRAIRAIDAANAADPNLLIVDGQERPKELAHAELVTRWVEHLHPEPSEALLLAARAHHLRRWTVARASYPSGRSGYLKWRTRLHEQHAVEVAEILDEVGYDAATIARVQDIVRKRGLGTDPEVQALEDSLCLVFFETQLRDLVARVDPETMTGIVAKTSKKMSDRALALALDLDLEAEDRALLLRVLGGQ
jgi:hypothetical protein